MEKNRGNSRERKKTQGIKGGSVLETYIQLN
jgi:hypothetical protein